jgi:hypothetical protein
MRMEGGREGDGGGVTEGGMEGGGEGERREARRHGSTEARRDGGREGGREPLLRRSVPHPLTPVTTPDYTACHDTSYRDTTACHDTIFTAGQDAVSAAWSERGGGGRGRKEAERCVCGVPQTSRSLSRVSCCLIRPS